MKEKDILVYSGSIKRAIESIPIELAILSEEFLRKKVNPSLKHYNLKRCFWEEFAFASGRAEKMRNWRIFEGNYSKSYFYDSILKDHTLMAWIMTPLVEYVDKTKAALDKVTERYNELIDMDISTTKKIKDPEEDSGYRYVTETCPKKALVLLSVIKNLEDRVNGTSIQRQVSVHTSKPSDGGTEEPTLDMTKINERMQELEKKLNPYGPKQIEENNAEKSNETRTLHKVCDDIETEGRRIEPVDR